jgi:RNA polymerase sigma-B factor
MTALQARPDHVADAKTPATRSPDPADRWNDTEYQHLAPLLNAYVRCEHDDPHRAQLRQELIVGFSPVAENLARRFAQRGVPVEDLTQVGMIGLIHSVDRYNPDLSQDGPLHGGFLGYAIPTIRGEIRRYFRDHTWSMRVPRRLKELHVNLSTATAQLSNELGRAPRPSEIAAHLDISVDEVLEGLQAGEAHRSSSLDQQLQSSGNDISTNLGSLLGQADARLELTENCLALKPLLAALPERERTILMLRFYGDKTQTQIAEVMGLSQMHVSRLITASLRCLRAQLEDDSPAGEQQRFNIASA